MEVHGLGTRHLLAATGGLEAVTGIALLLAPSAVSVLLLGAPLGAAPANTVGRVAGAALLALGVACWQARGEGWTRAVRGLVAGMLLYDVAVVALLVDARIDTGTAGPAFWLAVVVHSGLGLGCLAALAAGRTRDP